MKTQILLALGTVVLAAAAFHLNASDALFSPRGTGNQIKFAKSSADAPTTTIVYVDSNPGLLSPRAQGNQIRVVAGVHNDVNPALVCQKSMIGSPRAIAECASHPGAPMPCCNLAMEK